MTKKHFIALADAIIDHNKFWEGEQAFSEQAIETLAVFCKRENSNFDRERWLDYVNGKCGPNGGKR